MYQVVNQKKKFKNVEFSEEIYGFPMASSKKVFTIEKLLCKIRVVNSENLSTLKIEYILCKKSNIRAKGIY